MDEKACIPFSQICFKHRFLHLFISLIALLVIYPFLENAAYLRTLFSAILTAVFISAIYAISQKRHHALIAIFLALPALASTWGLHFYVSNALFLVGRVSMVMFYIIVIINILSFIFKQDEVSRDLIVGAAVVYLLIALMWSNLYIILETLSPGSFAMPGGPLQYSRYLFVYYSFITITTLGYGDVTPLTSMASSVSTLEAIIGQLYLIITVAWLVGVHVSQSMQRRSR
ncbi:MAG: potassium channel family protein [Syntrophobacterales bacterium]|jgi:hypothetical protein